MNFNKLLSIILITFAVLLCNINLCLGNNTQNTSIAINPMRLPDIDPITNPATDNWLTREVARQVNKDNVNELTQSDFMKIISITKEKEEIDTIPSEIGNLYNLYSLILSYNNIEVIPNELCNLVKLDNLKIDHNNITEIPDNIFNLIQLAGLDLGYNSISFISGKIGNLINLYSLNLNNNNLVIIPPEIGNMKKLNSLYLDNNKLKSIPPEIGKLEDLDVLSLLNNKIPFIPSEIGCIKKLSTLNLNDNCIIEVPTELLNLEYMKTLRISGQEITLSSIVNTSNKIIIKSPIKCFDKIIRPINISNYGIYDSKSNNISWNIDSSIKELNLRFVTVDDLPSGNLSFSGVVTIPIISDEDAIALNAEIRKAKDLLESDDVTSDELIESISGLSNAITVYEKSHSNK